MEFLAISNITSGNSGSEKLIFSYGCNGVVLIGEHNSPEIDSCMYSHKVKAETDNAFKFQWKNW